MPTLKTTDGTEIFYKDWGSGPAVTLSHGWPLNADAWDVQSLFLVQNGYRVIAHDRRGHRRSSQTSSGNDMDGYADDLALVMNELDLTGATMVGHSTGGGEAARYIGRHGSRRRRPRGARRRRTAGHGAVRGQPGRPAHQRLRRPPARPRQRPFAVLQGPRPPVLWREPPGGECLGGATRPVLAVGHAGRPQERLRKHQSCFGDRLHRGPQQVRCAVPCAPRRR
ncbi:MAG: alpha/beta fold hydrolase [Hyphomicrobiales bacterium]